MWQVCLKLEEMGTVYNYVVFAKADKGSAKRLARWCRQNGKELGTPASNIILRRSR